MKHLGDFDLSAVIYGMFNTFDPATGGLVTLGGSGASLIVFKNNGTSESQAGVTLTIDFDSRTGCHTYAIDTSADGTFYSSGGAFSVVINGGTAGAVSLAGAEVASFSLRKDSSLKTGTNSGAVSFTGGVTITNAGGSALTLTSSGGNGDGLSATGNGTGDGIAATSGATGRGIHAVGATGMRIEGTAATGNGLEAFGTTSGDGFHGQGGSSGRGIHARGGSASGAGMRIEGIAGNANGLETVAQGTGIDLAADNLADIELVTDKLDGMLTLGSGASSYQYTDLALARVWDEPIADHLTAGSTGASLNGAGSAGDPWTTALPGAYGAGTAGFIVGTNLDATVSSRASAANLAVVDGVVDAILLDTDAIDTRLPPDPADASVIASATNAILTAVDDVPTNAELNARTLVAADYATATALATVDGVVDAILLDTGTDGVVVAAASKSDYRLSATGVNDLLRTALTEGYAADGSTFTLEQALYMIWSLLAERSIVSTTLTARQLDGSTAAMTFTLDSATTPTSQTRAT